MRLYTHISVFEIMNALYNFLIFVIQSNLWYIYITMESNLSTLALKCGQINGYRLGLISLTILPSLFKFYVNFSLISSKFGGSGCYEILYMLCQLCCHPLCINGCNQMIWYWITAKPKFDLICIVMQVVKWVSGWIYHSYIQNVDILDNSRYYWFP